MKAHATPITRVVTGTDFSPGGTAAVARAARLPLAKAALVEIVYVLPDNLPAKLRAKVEADAARRLEHAAEAARGSAHRAGNTTVEIKHVLLQGQGHVELIRHARRREADLIVIGRHSRRPLRDLFVGSTAERVVRMSGIPVLVVNTTPSRPYRRPIAAVDLDDTARHVTDALLRVVDPGTQMCWLVHAYHIPYEGFIATSMSAARRAEYRKHWKDQAAVVLRRLATDLRPTGLRWKTILRPGLPQSVIVAEAARRRVDVVAVGTHARTGLAHALLGSVARCVLRDVACDVLVARPSRFTFELP